MSRRVSGRLKRKSTILQEPEQQSARRRRRVEDDERADQPPSQAIPVVDNLIERVTNAVLQKLQSTEINDNTGNGNVLLPETASAVQGSVAVEPGIRALSGSRVNTSESVDSSDQPTTAAEIVQGSIATVLDSLSGSTSSMSKPKDIFVSSDIPTVSYRVTSKIWAHEYIDFGLL